MSQAGETWSRDVEHPPPDVRLRLRRILLMSDMARCKDDYEFLDRYVHNVTYFADLPPRERLRYLRMVKGVELERGEELFHIGDSADAFYCIMYGSLNVVVDFAHMTAPTVDGFDEIINRARIHSTFLNPGGPPDISQGSMYVVRYMKSLECFGDVGLLTSDQLRTASVVANEKTLCMKIDREAFLELRKSYSDRELREKIKFLAGIHAFDHWDADNILRLTGRMEKVNYSYNDVVIKEGEPANNFYFVKHGECRLVKQFPSLRMKNQSCFVEVGSVSNRQYFGAFEVINGVLNAECSALVASPSAILYRVDRIDFRQTILKDSITDSMMRAESVELEKRINVDNVRKDLERDLQWTQYKREVVSEIIEKHQREHASPLHGQRSSIPIQPVKMRVPVITVAPPVRLHSSAPAPSVRGRIGRLIVDEYHAVSPTRSPTPGKRHSRWLNWAKQRASEIVNDTEGNAQSEPGTSGEPKSNIQWRAASKIMGGLDDETKITSAIVSLFAPSETH